MTYPVTQQENEALKFAVQDARWAMEQDEIDEHVLELAHQRMVALRDRMDYHYDYSVARALVIQWLDQYDMTTDDVEAELLKDWPELDRGDSLFERMLNIVKQTGLPSAFLDDVRIHDREYVMGDDRDEQFGWLIRDAGSDIISKGNTYSRVQLKYYADHYHDAKAIFFLVDGDTIRMSSPTKLTGWFNGSYK